MTAKIEEVIRRLILPEIQKIVKEEVADLRTTMDERFKGVDDRLKSVDAHLNTVSSQISDLRVVTDERFKAVNERLKGVDTRLNGVDDRISGLREVIETLKLTPRLLELERKVAALEIKAAAKSER